MITFAHADKADETTATFGLWVFVVSSFVVGSILIYLSWSQIQASKKQPVKAKVAVKKSAKTTTKKPAAKKKSTRRK